MSELETVRVSRNPSTVITASGEVQTNEEATVYVHDLDLLVTLQVLEDTLEVLSVGKLCEDHGYSYEWISGQKMKENPMQHGKLCNDRCPRISDRFFQFDCISCIVTAGHI